MSQNATIDSLKIELSIHAEKDSIRVNLLNKLAFSYFSKDMPKTLGYLEEADAIAEVIHFKKGKARSIYIRGITKAIQANYDQALGYYNEALQLYESIDFKKGIANTYNAMGITYKNKGEMREAVSYYKKAISIEEEIGSNNLSASLLNLGTSYSVLGNYSEALSYLKKALSIAKDDENEQRVAYSLNNLGSVYRDQGNYPLALEHFNESLYIHEKLGDSIGIANNLINMGWIYKTQGHYDKAMSYYGKSLEINKRINRMQGISSVLNDIGILHEENGDYQSALDHYLNAFGISKQIGAKSEIPFILNNIGTVYLALKDYGTANQYLKEAKKNGIETESKLALCGTYIGLSRTFANQKEYDSALSNALKAKKISIKSGFLGYQKEASEILSEIYTATGKYKDALASHQQFKVLNDSLFNKENIEKIAQIEYEYKYQQQKDSANFRELKLYNTILSTTQDLKASQRNSFIAIIVILIISIISGSIIFLLKLRHIKATNQNILIEQKLLRSQMTPHFIFNSLSVLQGMILNKEEQQSISYLSKFSKLLRTILENSRHKTVLLSEELSAIDSYMDLQNLDTNPPYVYHLSVDDKININRLKIPPMLIQPFIENSIEHAFIEQKDHKEITIAIKFKNETLECIIEDNGIGINTLHEKKKRDKNSLATTITSERLKALSNDFGVHGSINVQNRAAFGKQGTLVTLMIPYKI